jgi:hypothetical protein
MPAATAVIGRFICASSDAYRLLGTPDLSREAGERAI